MKSKIKPVKIRNNPKNTEHNKERLEFYTLTVLRIAKKSQLWQNKKILENKNKNPELENSHRCLITVPHEIKNSYHFAQRKPPSPTLDLEHPISQIHQSRAD